MKSLASKSYSVPMKALGRFSPIFFYLSLWLALYCPCAKGYIPGIEQYNVFGERCHNEGCGFDASTVGRELHKYCLSKDVGGGRPIQLVRPARNHLGLEIVEEGLNALRRFQKPLSIVAVIGSVKTGKSSFLNLLNEHVLCGDGRSLDGFAVNDEASPTTSGIWLWSKPIEVTCRGLKAWIDNDTREQGLFSSFLTTVDSIIGGGLKTTLMDLEITDLSVCMHEKVNIVLMDVEGFNATDGFKRYDEALFTIASTLSSELVYLTQRVIDARNVMELQNMLQMSNLAMVNIHKALSNAPHVEIKEDGKDSSVKVVSVMSRQGKNNADNQKPVKGKVDKSHFQEFQLHRNSNLTIVVKGFNQRLNVSALEYITEIVNGKRYDLSYQETKSFFTNMESLRKKFFNLFRDDDSKEMDQGCKNRYLDNLLSRMTNGYKYVIPHQFDAIDVLLTSEPFFGEYRGPIKSHIVKGFLEQLLKYKIRLFKRCLGKPKQRTSPVKETVSFMSGEDLADLLSYLVISFNSSMKSGTMDSYIGDIRMSRANMVKRDLVDLYASELALFVNQVPIPLESSLHAFNKDLQVKYIELLALHAKYDIPEEGFDGISSSFKSLMKKTMDHYTQLLYDVTVEYCQSKIPIVKNLIREKIADFKIPVLPSVLKDLEKSKEELLHLYRESLDENVANYSSSPACKTIGRDVESFISDVVQNLYDENDRAISVLFQEASRLALENYNSRVNLNATDIYKVCQREFINKLNTWVSDAYDVFYKKIGCFKKLDKYMSMTLAHLRKELKAAEKEALQQWNHICKESSREVVNRFTNTFDAQLLKLVPYRPAPKAVLLLAVDYIRTQGWYELEGLYCGGSQIVKLAQADLIRSIDESRKKCLTDNYEAIFKIFQQNFQILEKEAFNHVTQVYHFQQLKIHLQKYAALHVFNKVASLDRSLMPKGNITELLKNVNTDFVKTLPADSRLRLDLEGLNSSLDPTAVKLVGLGLQTVREDLVDYWLETKLYPVIRHKLTLRMPKLATSVAIIAFISSSVLVFTVRNNRIVSLLYVLVLASIVQISGPRKIMALLTLVGIFIWRFMAHIVARIGPLWTYVISVSIVAIMAMWYIWLYRLSPLFRRGAPNVKPHEKHVCGSN